ncbi:hypothetical protein [Ruegeria sp. YS9]|uniref:hypothetical protein n=1 Tax=Ruegeria sp. YS9 TaxID=2966453 RepID=UPI00214BE455|nr:hypothetical protein [Ruegeria sp. YS9]UUV07376.1 hypothetical protein NOR97_06360 [Ruegeria sp. YS9]
MSRIARALDLQSLLALPKRVETYNRAKQNGGLLLVHCGIAQWFFGLVGRFSTLLYGWNKTEVIKLARHAHLSAWFELYDDWKIRARFSAIGSFS